MSGIELALAIVGVIEPCVRLGRELVATCQAFREADSRLSESVVHIEACWVRISQQLELVKNLAHLMDPYHRDVQNRMLEVLLTKLKVAGSKLNGLTEMTTASSSTATAIVVVSASASDSISMPTPAASTSASSVQLGLRSLAIQPRRLKYALTRKSLADAIADLEAWQTVFDPTWFLIMKIASPEIDRLLSSAAAAVRASSSISSAPAPHPDLPTSSSSSSSSSSSTTIPAARYLRRAISAPTADGSASATTSIFLPAAGLQPNTLRRVPFSPCSLAHRADGEGRLVLLDPVTCTTRPSAAASAVVRDVRDFARRLAHADPALFGLLQCKGVLKDYDSNDGGAGGGGDDAGLAFVFRLPAEHGPSSVQSVRHALIGGEEYESLSERFALAARLVRAVSYVHLYGFVHKNIRPETVVTLGATGAAAAEENKKPLTVLVGFDIFRDANGKTYRVGDDNWEKNLYRHPQRQGRQPKDDYEMRHDIYSVGVVLLEIGLWESFITYADAMVGEGPAIPTAVLTRGLFSDRVDGVELMRDPDRVKAHLLLLARTALQKKMGTRYSRVVETCLTCLDKGNEDFGDESEFQDEDGVAVGVRYIEKVVGKLGDIVV